ncbi:MAG: hypothetical protein N2323_03310 [candidate division WOR-3 bacterium]|nr:hypothetical protein [candidate division WOR-3 bacterium]MCX7836970.1 hypothetical protein [candidate division WOR-3 bacterium]MDW8114098.1 hypothetical protein [candidate division WOR-3 bacterium]
MKIIFIFPLLTKRGKNGKMYNWNCNKKEVADYCLKEPGILDDWKLFSEEFKNGKEGDKCFIYDVQNDKLYGVFEAKSKLIRFSQTPFRFGKITLDLKIELKWDEKNKFTISNGSEILKDVGIKLNAREILKNGYLIENILIK